MQTEHLKTDHLNKAFAVFLRFRQNLSTDQEKAGAVQAFEFCYELAWKLMKRILEMRGLEVGSPKDTFRKAFEEQLIDDPELWFEFQKKRNLTAHTYNEENLDIIIDSFSTFAQEMQKLIVKLEKL
jgi:nucleotidyltransferase substrate binding protein (TIGR01987 family)